MTISRGVIALLLGALVACGSPHHGAGPDAAGPGPDGAGPDASRPPGSVSITVEHGLPARPVIFLAPDDSVVSVTTTDANGYAAADVQPGGSVTLVLPAAQKG